MDPLYCVVLILAAVLAGVWFLRWITADHLASPVPIPLFDRDGYLCELLSTTPLDYGDNDEPAN